MFIEKEPAKAAEAKKVGEALQKDPMPDPAQKKGLQGMGFEDQSKALSARKPAAAVPAVLPQASSSGVPLTEVRRLFRENGLPEILVPSNLVDFRYEPSTGALVLTLNSAFSRKFDEENPVRFDRVIAGVLQNGAFSGISGITRGNAAIVSMARTKPGVIAIGGRQGPFGKSLEIRDESLPALP